MRFFQSNNGHFTQRTRHRYSFIILVLTAMLAYGPAPGQITRAERVEEVASVRMPEPAPSEFVGAADREFSRFIEEQDSVLDRLLPQRSAERGEFNLHDMDRWNEPGDKHEEVVVAFHQKRLGGLESFDAKGLSRGLLTQYEVMRFESQLAIEGAKFKPIADAFAANHFFSVPSDLESWLHSKHRVSNEAEAKAYIARLRGVSDLFKKIIAKVESARSRGIVAPRSELEEAIGKYRKMADGMLKGASTLNKDVSFKFENFPALGQEATKVVSGVVAPAYLNLASYLETSVLPQAKPAIGLYQYPGGSEYYRYLLKVQTSLDLTPEKVIELGNRAVATLEKEMLALKKRMGRERATLRAFFDEYRGTGCLSSEEMKAAMEKKAAEMQPHWSKLFEGSLPTVKIVFDPFEGRAREELDFTVNPPQPTFYLNPNAKADNCIYTSWDMLELLTHEGIPGHGLEQYSTASLPLPRFRKNFSVNAYSEGWGLYAESLAKEVGFYRNNEEELGRLSSALFRACRLVVDAGIHSGKLSRETATEFLLGHSPYPKPMIESQVSRYVAMPAQACCYYIGADRIWNLRKRSEEMQGHLFDVRKFHTAVLQNGNLPLEMLERNVNQAIVESVRANAGRSNADIKVKFTLCDKPNGKEFLSVADDFTDTMSEFDRRARVRSLSTVSKAAFLEFAGSVVQDWTPAERVRLMEIISRVRPKLEGLSVSLPDDILVIKTSGVEEGRTAYTRRNAIILPENYIAGKNDEKLEDLLTHEAWHIISRYNPRLKTRVYALLGFSPCSVRLNDSLRGRKITNPDAIEYSYCCKVTHQGRSIRVAPVLYAVKQYDGDPEKKEFFDYMASYINAGKRKWNRRVPSLLEIGGAKRIFDVWEVQGFDIETFGVDYLFHPEEMSAEHFVKLMRNDFTNRITLKMAKELYRPNKD